MLLEVTALGNQLRGLMLLDICNPSSCLHLEAAKKAVAGMK